ncbi:hypothetical protein DPMN_030277 [Dreissena polymorpha]|uniref:Uncharacterized protein n=1 Tax=Dreissena polymorpha TaxID=45954 RepID=A0A9D4RHX5_DREPO|nr:hypothetical protein DPMN_030277 [Dreissena polymorpha]
MNWTSTVKTAPPPGGHVFLPTGTIFELVKDFIGTHVPTKKTATPPGTQFHEDWTINETSKAQKAITKAHHEHVVLSCSSSHCVNTFFVTVNGGGGGGGGGVWWWWCIVVLVVVVVVVVVVVAAAAVAVAVAAALQYQYLRMIKWEKVT